MMLRQQIFVFFAMTAIAAAVVQDDLQKCCSKGKQWAIEQRNGCDNFIIPVENVPSTSQTLCIAAMEICCTNLRREQQCQLGLKAGQAGRQCLKLSGVGGTTFRDCCMGCKLGLQISPRAEVGHCRTLGDVLGPPWSGPFARCCEEIHNGTFTEPAAAAVEPQQPKGSLDVAEATRVSLSKPNICPHGFRYNSRLNVCDDVDECQESGAHDCLDQTEVCQNTVGSYICEDVVGGSEDGQECPRGFRFFLTSCIDVDECLEGTHDCSAEKVCLNKDGGFNCQLPPELPANFNAINCPMGYEPSGETGRCEDINECKNEQHSCHESQRCDNTLGSYACVRYTTCGTGYTLNYDTGRCEDDDECATGTHNCRQLGQGYLCLNMQGSFRCEKRRCGIGEILGEDGLCSLLRCQTGFEPGPAGNCIDVDECNDYEGACGSGGSGSNFGSHGLTCVNTMGSFECVSKCEVGLQLDPSTNRCKDVDECSLGLSTCLGGTQCTNTIGSYRCSCAEGFKQSAASGQCEDVNECVVTRGNVCGIDSECQNSIGSYRCICKPGFSHKNGVCVDINECQEIASACQQRCTNLWGSYRCHCQPGFRLSPDGRTCLDVNECIDYDDLCIGNCVNEPGSYKCTCPQGYQLSSNSRSCQDIDECLQPDNPCKGANRLCFNTRGGYKCNDISCPPDYELEEGHDRRCRRVASRCLSDDAECLRKPVSISHNFIALISNLRVQGQGVNLFTMQSARYRLLTTKFTLNVKDVRAPADVTKASASNFRLSTASHSAILSIVQPIQGPQDVTLELLMEMYHMGRFQASAAANIYIFVTPYEF